MSVFGNIMSAIFDHSAAKAQPGSTAAGSAATSAPPIQPGQVAAPSGAGQSSVDVEAVLSKLANQSSQKLDWRRSIVDLMKLLNLDSSLAARKELAKELHYSGSTDDSAAMNIWLHKQVMIKLAENGGKVPEALKV